MSKKKGRWSFSLFAAGLDPYRSTIKAQPVEVEAPYEKPAKLLPVSTLVDYLKATRGYVQRSGESLLEAVAAELCKAHGFERGKHAARRFVERHRQLVRDGAKNAPKRAPSVSFVAPGVIAHAQQEAVREAKTIPNELAASAAFLETYEWRRVRMQALKKYGARCQCCGASPATGAVMNVDHIKPRRLFPELALDLNNLQVLCGDCNHGKGNWDMTDWRAAIGASDG